MLFAGLQAAVSERVENRQSVIIEFHFILMPGSHREPEPQFAAWAASREPGAGLRANAMPVWRTEGRQRHEPGIRLTRRERAEPRIRRFDRARNSENANEPTAHRVARNA